MLFAFLCIAYIAKAQWTNGTDIYNTNTGNVGVGITTPPEKLTVVGNFKLSGGIYWDWPNRIIEIYSADGYSQAIRFRNSMGTGFGNPNGGFDFADHLGTSVMRINNYAVGIGTTNTGTFKLAVEGKIGAREVRVTNANPWPDYVFGDQYKLKTLATLEGYIKKNNHLPNMPSAREVKNNGIELGNMNTRVVEKIEELTLYVIELNKRMAKLEKENARLRNQLKK